MSIVVGAKIIAEARIQTVALRRLVGAYEIMFPLQVQVLAGDAQPRGAMIAGADVLVRGAAGNSPLGFSRPSIPLRLVPGKFGVTLTATFFLTLSPSQIEALEALRDGSDLSFELTIAGEAHEGQNVYPFQDQLYAGMPRSAWIDQLRNVGALNVLMLEIPMRVDGAPEIVKTVQGNLIAAQRHFVNGEYTSCISSCRNVLEALGQLAYGSDWPSSCWADLINANSRQTMTREKREQAIMAVIRHYAHLAHHPEGNGGIPAYSRPEAKLALSLTAAVANRLWGG